MIFHILVLNLFTCILFKQVNPKRTNKPGISTTNRLMASRGMFRGCPMSRGLTSSFYGGYRPSRRPRYTFKTLNTCVN